MARQSQMSEDPVLLVNFVIPGWEALASLMPRAHHDTTMNQVMSSPASSGLTSLSPDGLGSSDVSQGLGDSQPHDSLNQIEGEILSPFNQSLESFQPFCQGNIDTSPWGQRWSDTDAAGQSRQLSGVEQWIARLYAQTDQMTGMDKVLPGPNAGPLPDTQRDEQMTGTCEVLPGPNAGPLPEDQRDEQMTGTGEVLPGPNAGPPPHAQRDEQMTGTGEVLPGPNACPPPHAQRSHQAQLLGTDEAALALIDTQDARTLGPSYVFAEVVETSSTTRASAGHGNDEEGHWRKDGEKKLANTCYVRSHFHCKLKDDLGCPARKTVDHFKNRSPKLTPRYKKLHNHPSSSADSLAIIEFIGSLPKQNREMLREFVKLHRESVWTLSSLRQVALK